MSSPPPLPAPASATPLELDAAALRDAVAALDLRSVECAMGDFSALARGKVVSARDFVAAGGCRLPSVLLGMTTTGGSPAELFGTLLPADYKDMALLPDLATLARRPARGREAAVICEPSGSWAAPRYGRELGAHELSPRAALRRVLDACAAQGLQATVAPELEMFLLRSDDPGSGIALSAPPPRPGAPTREQACEQYSLERTTHFEAFFDELYAAAAAYAIPLAGHLHEAALSQYEVNFDPGAPLAQADAVFRFKRLAREIAVRHGFLASFAAKPFLDQPGVGMHWHFSLQRQGAAWPHLFADPGGRSSPELMHFVAGLQAHAAQAMALFAPYDMSYDRIVFSDSAPTHADWGDDDRHAAFRIPASGAAARRVENRLPGGDSNPYLVIAATLALGLEGLRAQRPPHPGREDAARLPRALPEALDALDASTTLRRWLGDPLLDLFIALKRDEHRERAARPDPRQWDLRHLIEAS